MSELILKLFGIFSFKSKKPLFIILSVVGVIVFLWPSVFSPIIKGISIRSRINLIAKINTIDKNKIKEPVLKKSFEKILFEINSNDKAIMIEKKVEVKNLKDYFNRKNIKDVFSASFLWLLLSVICMFLKENKLVTRVSVVLLFILIAIISSIIVINLQEITPYFVFAIFIILGEVLIISLIGTLSNEIKR